MSPAFSRDTVRESFRREEGGGDSSGEEKERGYKTIGQSAYTTHIRAPGDEALHPLEPSLEGMIALSRLNRS